LPIYQYTCDHCGHTWDATYKISNRKDPEQEPCPECQKLQSIRQCITSVSFGMENDIRSKISKPQGEFKEVLSKIHEKTPRSRLNKVIDF
jgi:putative FmdB family regulatory protein